MVINMKRTITEEKLAGFWNYLLEEERSRNTVEKYLHDVRKLMNYAQGREITKNLMMKFKETLMQDEQEETQGKETGSKGMAAGR
ncbi:MAG: site-specific integrase [Muribaculaceae bacterium]|nr:site-specific integrase [Muribaculaceae bacterium]